MFDSGRGDLADPCLARLDGADDAEARRRRFRFGTIECAEPPASAHERACSVALDAREAHQCARDRRSAAPCADSLHAATDTGGVEEVSEVAVAEPGRTAERSVRAAADPD